MGEESFGQASRRFCSSPLRLSGPSTKNKEKNKLFKKERTVEPRRDFTIRMQAARPRGKSKIVTSGPGHQWPTVHARACWEATPSVEDQLPFPVFTSFASMWAR